MEEDSVTQIYTDNYRQAIVVSLLIKINKERKYSVCSIAPDLLSIPIN